MPYDANSGVSLSPEAPPGFDEAGYLAAFPDVAEAVGRGELASALDHYHRAGHAEGRLQRPEYRRSLQGAGGGLTAPRQAPAFGIDAVTVSDSGAVFIAGWADDRQDPLMMVSVRIAPGTEASWSNMPRLRRADVEAALPAPRQYHYGFWAAGTIEHRSGVLPAGANLRVDLTFAGGAVASVERPAGSCGDTDLRDTALGYLAACGYYGNHAAESFESLDRGAGDWLLGFNRAICRGITRGATVERFGPRRARYRGSIIVPLYGIAAFMFVQACTYAGGAGIEDYEFIYVNNSPELAETLHREARIAQSVYGLPVSLVTLPGNAGFGPANNVGLDVARSDRLLCINPDVFPRDPDWARRHSDLVAALPPHETRLFGTSLFYDDGSLMHGGMYFEADQGIIARPDRIHRRTVLRVEHHGKGAPHWAGQFVASRPVPAVTGAFISADRTWFEKIGGFTEDYVFGHYEDADLCLKSLRAGVPAWLHDVPMWHLEGKGSRRLPQHEGGALLNRWLFTRTWEPMLVPGLIGRDPDLMRAGAGALPAAAAAIPRVTNPRRTAPAAMRRHPREAV